MGGDIQLRNLVFKPNFFDDPYIPFALRYGSIDLIKVKLVKLA